MCHRVKSILLSVVIWITVRGTDPYYGGDRSWDCVVVHNFCGNLSDFHFPLFWAAQLKIVSTNCEIMMLGNQVYRYYNLLWNGGIIFLMRR